MATYLYELAWLNVLSLISSGPLNINFTNLSRKIEKSSWSFLNCIVISNLYDFASENKVLYNEQVRFSLALTTRQNYF